MSNGANPTRVGFRDHIGWGKNKSLQIINELRILKVLRNTGISGSGNTLEVSKDFTELFYLSPRK
jgi:hypothetical protein